MQSIVTPRNPDCASSSSKLVTLLSLLTHELYLECRFDEHDNKFMIGKTFACGGVLKRIKARFFPRYEYQRNKTEPPAWKRTIKSSTAVGSAVDREVQALVNRRGIRSIRDPNFPTHTVLLKTRRFFERLDELDIVAVFAEFPVVSREKGVGTRIDLIGVRYPGTTRERIVTIERKTGYTAGMYKTQGMMEAPLAHVKNNPFNQHQVQSMVGALLFERCYGVKVDEKYVLYTDWKRNYWRALPTCMRQPRALQQRVWDHLSNAKK